MPYTYYTRMTVGGGKEPAHKRAFRLSADRPWMTVGGRGSLAPVPDFSHHRAARHWAWNRGVESVYEKGSEEIENHFFIAFLSCSQEVVNGGVSGRLLSKSYFIPFSCSDVIFIEVSPDIDGLMCPHGKGERRS